MKKDDGWSIRNFIKFRQKFFKILTLGVGFLLWLNVAGQAKVNQTVGRVSFELKEVTLTDFIEVMKQKTDLKFLYNSMLFKDSRAVSVSARDEKWESVLKRVLEQEGFMYDVEDDIVVIKALPAVKQEEKSRLIRGTVKDEQGAPLPGVTILFKGTNIGTATDKDGKFTLEVIEGVKALLVRFVGKETLTVELAEDKTAYEIVLKDDVAQIDEVVVNGYQTLKKRSMAGSVSTVSSKDLVINGMQTLEQALQGKLPGMMVINQSGLTGTRQKVRVRGTATLIGNPDPVWVVDGIIQEDPLPFNASQLTDIGENNIDMIKDFVGGAISWLNPQDIENIAVLKDASATAIYGVKAANGVIVITTKKGERGRMSVGYNGSFSLSAKMNYNKLELMNSKERVEASREAFEKGGITTREDAVGYMALALAYRRREISYEEFDRRAKKLETVNTDWFDILFRTPFSHNHNLSISGGSDKTTYRASFGVNDVNNTARGNDQRQYTANVNVTSTFWDRLTVSMGIAGSTSETNAFAETDPFTYANNTSRAIPCREEDGSLYFYPKGENNYLYNILFELENSGNKNTVSNLSANLNLRLVLGYGFTYTTTVGYNTSSAYGEQWWGERSNYITAFRSYEFGKYAYGDKEYTSSPLPIGGLLNVTESRNNNYTWRNQVEYAKTFGRHVVNVMFGQESRSNKYDGFSQSTFGYMPDRGKSFAIVPLVIGSGGGVSNEKARSTPTVTDRKANYLSFYGNMSYMFDDRYAVNASVRMDASNRFGQDRDARYQPVWSVGGRWNLTREHWLEGQNILNDVSLRASFGYQGNVAENVGPDLIAKYVQVSSYSSERKLLISRLPNKKLRWEKNKSFNFGFDFSVLGSKLNGSFEYYYKRTIDMLTSCQVPYENGVTSMMVNGGNMTNSGWDLNVSLVPVRTKNFVWTLGLTTGKVYNKVKSTIEPTGDWYNAVGGSLNKEGYPVTSFWAFRYKGLDHDTGVPLIDMTGANTIEARDDATEYMVWAGKLEPDFTAGLTTSFRYKSLTLSTNFYLSTGNQKFLASPFKNFQGYNRMPSEYENMSSEIVHRWRKPGDEAHTDIPALPLPQNLLTSKPFYNEYLPFYPYEAFPYSDIRVVDAWYLRCNNLTLSYNMPEKLISRFAQNISFSFSMSNPFSIVSKDFHGRDPEVASGSQPLSRNYSFSMNVSV